MLKAPPDQIVAHYIVSIFGHELASSCNLARITMCCTYFIAAHEIKIHPPPE